MTEVQVPDGVYRAADRMLASAFVDGSPDGIRDVVAMAYLAGRLDEQEPAGKMLGHCPMGCGQTLWLTRGGRARCSAEACPNYDAVHQLLADEETEHVVVLEDDGFTVRHPLRERLGDALLDCFLHRQIAASAGPPHQPGRYRVTSDGADGWAWAKLPDAPRRAS